MEENKAKIIIQDFGLEQLAPIKSYGNIAATVLQNEITGHIPEISDFTYEGQVKALEARDESKKPNTGQYNGKVGVATVGDTPDGNSILGTPVWGRLVINSGTYFDTTYGQITYPEIILDTVLFTITQVHNVKLTPIQGRDYEVIEYIGKASYRINAKGGIFGNGNKRPLTDIVNLKYALNSNQPLTVGINSFLSEWDINEIVILDKTIPQIAGGYNYQLFEFNAIQNVPVILAQSNA